MALVNQLACDGSGKKNGCATRVPHDHCECGLPKRIGTKYCQDCRREGLRPHLVASDEETIEWDGVSYPSYRCRRRTRENREAYWRLLEEILIPNLKPWRIRR